MFTQVIFGADQEAKMWLENESLRTAATDGSFLLPVLALKSLDFIFER